MMVMTTLFCFLQIPSGKVAVRNLDRPFVTRGKLSHLGMSYRHIGDGVYYELDRTSYNEICAMSINYEKSLKQPIEDKTDDEVDLENQKGSGSDSGSDTDNDTEQERGKSCDPYPTYPFHHLDGHQAPIRTGKPPSQCQV